MAAHRSRMRGDTAALIAWSTCLRLRDVSQLAQASTSTWQAISPDLPAIADQLSALQARQFELQARQFEQDEFFQYLLGRPTDSESP